MTFERMFSSIRLLWLLSGQVQFDCYGDICPRLYDIEIGMLKKPHNTLSSDPSGYYTPFQTSKENYKRFKSSKSVGFVKTTLFMCYVKTENHCIKIFEKWLRGLVVWRFLHTEKIPSSILGAVKLCVFNLFYSQSIPTIAKVIPITWQYLLIFKFHICSHPWSSGWPCPMSFLVGWRAPCDRRRTPLRR